jgi:hypothetical protein
MHDRTRDDAIHAALMRVLRSYGLASICTDDGDPYPLVDALSTPGDTIATGEEEMRRLADALLMEVRDVV